MNRTARDHGAWCEVVTLRMVGVDGRIGLAAVDALVGRTTTERLLRAGLLAPDGDQLVATAKGTARLAILDAVDAAAYDRKARNGRRIQVGMGVLLALSVLWPLLFVIAYLLGLL